MDDVTFRELHRSVQLSRFLWAEARRHFGKDEDLQRDAVQEGWLRIFAQPAGQDFEEYKQHGARAIHAMYGRLRRRYKRVPEVSIDDGEAEKPSSALHKLALKALAGDW